MNWKDRLFMPAQMLELAKSQDGKQELAGYIITACIERGLQHCFETMGNPINAMGLC
jgi:hypothetical protein